MAGHFQHLELRAEKISLWSFFDEEIGPGRLDFQFEPEIPEKLAIGDHRLSQGMATDLAIEAAFDFGDILDVVDVTVRQKEKLEIDLFRFKPFARPLRRIEQDGALRGGREVGIGLENPATERLIVHWSVESKSGISHRHSGLGQSGIRSPTDELVLRRVQDSTDPRIRWRIPERF
jgi:hypothetical protein